MNEERELDAIEQGYKYFDEQFDGKKQSKKFKREMSLNTSFWWFRKPNIKSFVFTNQIADIDYLYKVFKNETNVMIYYRDIANSIDLNDVLKHYKDSNVKFVKINFNPDEIVSFSTQSGKRIHFETLVLANDNTVIFDMKLLGLEKDDNGNTEVYRIKDKAIFSKIKNCLMKVL